MDWIVSRFRFVALHTYDKVLPFFHPHRYDRRPSSSSRRYSELLATGIVSEPTEEEWRRKDLSACILADDPECLPKTGEVLLNVFLAALAALYLTLVTQ